MKTVYLDCRVHSCFSQEYGVPKPKKCNCRKLVSKETAHKYVKDDLAEWVIDYSGDVPIPTWDIVLRGRVGKTPRAHTLEVAHMERYTERMYNPDFDSTESQELFNLYHDIEVEARLKLFGDISGTLLKAKQDSDNFGVVEGQAGKVLSDKIIQEVDNIKIIAAKNDPFPGRAVLAAIGTDQRTVGGVGKNVEKRLDRIEEE
jgi:hypothetical protein